MTDTIVAKGSDSKFTPHPEGQFVARCVDAIDMGEKVEQYPGMPKKLAPKCVLIFRTGEQNEATGELIDIGREFTVSMGKKANLRHFLEQWRGKPYDNQQIEDGVPLHKMAGNWALITVAHKRSEAGRTYANITAAVGIPKQMSNNLPSFPEYKRAEFWGTRRDEYKKEAQAFRAEAGAPPDDESDVGGNEEDDLPF